MRTFFIFLTDVNVWTFTWVNPSDVPTLIILVIGSMLIGGWIDEIRLDVMDDFLLLVTLLMEMRMLIERLEVSNENMEILLFMLTYMFRTMKMIIEILYKNGFENRNVATPQPDEVNLTLEQIF